MTIEIKKGKNIGNKRKAGRYPFADMKVGDYFIIFKSCSEYTENTLNNLKCATTRVKKNYGLEFTIKKYSDGVFCVRVY